jgi:hypothetical protein
LSLPWYLSVSLTPSFFLSLSASLCLSLILYASLSLGLSVSLCLSYLRLCNLPELHVFRGIQYPSLLQEAQTNLEN